MSNQANAILDSVAQVMTGTLRREGIELRAPVAVKFRTAESGSTGVEVVVPLSDPDRIAAATATIGEHFPDRLSAVVVV
jgi:hypothetical protein